MEHRFKKTETLNVSDEIRKLRRAGFDQVLTVYEDGGYVIVHTADQAPGSERHETRDDAS